jgi:hypothetical protein
VGKYNENGRGGKFKYDIFDSLLNAIIYPIQNNNKEKIENK